MSTLQIYSIIFIIVVFIASIILRKYGKHPGDETLSDYLTFAPIIAFMVFVGGSLPTAHADDQSYGACYNKDGAKVAIYWKSAEHLAEHNAVWGYAGQHFYTDGSVHPFMVIDESLKDDVSLHEFTQWVIAHECAHHRLGHVKDYDKHLHEGNYAHLRQMELDADVLASKRYSYLYSEKSLSVALEILAVSLSPEGSETHPPMQYRLDNIHYGMGLTN